MFPVREHTLLIGPGGPSKTIDNTQISTLNEEAGCALRSTLRQLSEPTQPHCNTLQHTATHCNTLQHTATHCNTPRLDRHTTRNKNCKRALFMWGSFAKERPENLGSLSLTHTRGTLPATKTQYPQQRPKLERAYT